MLRTEDLKGSSRLLPLQAHSPLSNKMFTKITTTNHVISLTDKVHLIHGPHPERVRENVKTYEHKNIFSMTFFDFEKDLGLLEAVAMLI